MPLTVIALGAALILPPLAAWWWYSGASTWPGLIGNFTASFFAFLIALSWDRSREQVELRREEDERISRDRAAAEAEVSRRRDEAVRRLGH